VRRIKEAEKEKWVGGEESLLQREEQVLARNL
jgi:hypothetical protein